MPHTTSFTSTRPRRLPSTGELQALRSACSGRRARRFHVTERDLRLLAFVSVHRFVLSAHVRAFLGVHPTVAYRRLAGLVGAGLLCHERIFHAQPGCYRITNGGLAAIGSELPRPTVDLRTYHHDATVAQLWVAELHGHMCPLRRLLTERQMRCADQHHNRDGDAQLLGVPLAVHDSSGRQRRHYPDLLLTTNKEQGVAVELELTLKSRRRLEQILIGYASDPGIDQVLYLTDSRAVARTLSQLTDELGLSDLVQVAGLHRGPARPPIKPPGYELPIAAIWTPNPKDLP